MSKKGALRIRKGNTNNAKAQLLALNNVNEELNEELNEEELPNINTNSPNNTTESVVSETLGSSSAPVVTETSGPTAVSGPPTTAVLGPPTTTKYSYTDVKHKVDQYKTQDPKQILDEKTGTSSDITDTLYLEQNLINVLNKSNENDNKTLGKILNDYFSDKVDGWVKLNESNIKFIDVDNNYAKDIDNAIQKDTKNKVAIFEYELPLYNLDSLSAFIAKLSNNNDLLEQYKNYITNFLQKINPLYNNFNVKDYSGTNKKYLTMYMPKLLNENRFDINATGAIINKLAGGTITKINNIKKNSSKTSTTKKQIIRNNFTKPSDEWVNMNNNKNKMYGFNTDEFKGIEFSLYSPEVSQYFNKCDDLQIFYIKKHIELFNLFKQMKKLIDFNVIINYSILELLDPDKAPLDTSGDMVELKHVFDKQTELDKLLKMQSDILLSKDSMKGGASTEAEALALSKSAASAVGPTQLKYDSTNKKIELTNLLLKLKTKIKPNDVVYIELNAEKKMLMKYEKQDADKYIFSNINIFNKQTTGDSDDKINDFLSDFNKLTGLDQETKTKLMNYILKGDSEYETLLAIKKIHDQNIDSLNVYLAEGTSLSLQERINNYEKEILNYDSDIKVAKPKQNGTEWKTTEYKTANTMYFDPINNKKYNRKDVKNTGSAQRAIYKCYDLQILYLIKHLEVIEMFKIEFYFADMLFKHFALLLFIIALYKRDFTDKGPNVNPEIREYIKSIPQLLSDQTSTIIKGGGEVKIDPTTELIDIPKVESAIDKLEKEINDKLELINELEKTTKESGPNDQIDLEVKLLKAASEKLKLLKQTTYDFDEPIFSRLQKQDDKIIQEITDKYDDIYQTYETKIPQQNKEIALEIQKLKIELQKKICPTGTSCPIEFKNERLEIMRKIIKSYKKRFEFVFGNSIITDDEDAINDYIKLLHIIRIYDLANPIFEKNLKNSKILETEKVQKIQDYIKAITEDLKLKDEGGTIGKMGTASIYLLKQALDKDAKEEQAKRVAALKKAQLEKQTRELEKIAQEAKIRDEEKEKARLKQIEDKKKADEAAKQALEKERVAKEEQERKNREEQERLAREEEERLAKEAEEQLTREEQERLAREAEEERLAKSAKTQETLKNLLNTKQFIIQYDICNKRYLAEPDKYRPELEKAYTVQKLPSILGILVKSTEIIKSINDFKDDDTNASTIFDRIKAEIMSIIPIENSAELFEIIMSAARVLIRIKTIDDNAPNKNASIKSDTVGNPLSIKEYKANYEKNSKQIFIDKSEGAKDYKKFRGINNSGESVPYKYEDILSIDDKNKITTLQTNYPNTNNPKTYGPFSALYGPKYNNWDIYYEMFGEYPIKELIEDIKLNEENYSPPEKIGKEKSKFGELKQGKNIQQKLLEKLISGGNVVIFGYGLSGSGKTWTTVEGSIFKESNPMYDPSLLELFIRQNFDVIQSIEFVDIYPLGDIKVIDKNIETNYADIEKTGDIQTFSKTLIERLKQIGIVRRKNLRVLATPNNDSSSRSFLQITINLKFRNNKSEDINVKLVFFDMPGTENTIKIKQEFLGNSFISYTENSGISVDYQEVKKFGEGNLYNNFSTYYNLYVKEIFNPSNKKKINVLAIDLVQKKTDSTKLDEDIKGFFKQIHIQCVKFLSNLNIGSGTDNSVIQYIAKISEELNLFFNGSSKKTFKEFVNDKTNNKKPLAILSEENRQNIAKTFLTKTIFTGEKLLANGDIEYKYFTLTQDFISRDKTKIDNISTNDKNKLDTTIKTIFDLPEPYNNNLIRAINETFGFKYVKQDSKIEEPTSKTAKTIDISKIKTIFNEGYGLNLESEKYEKQFYFKYTDSENECVMIKYIVGIINILSNSKSSTTSAEIIDILLIFIYKYVDFIVKQGEAIVTTLEHLKFFFLTNTANIDDYNKNPLGNYDPSTINKKENARFNGNPKRIGKMISDTELTSEEKKDLTYTIKTQIKLDNDSKITLDENVFIGNMKTYKLLGILQKLAGRDTNLVQKENTDKSFIVDLLKESKGQTQNKAKSLFLMLLHIKIFDYNYVNPDQNPKIPDLIKTSINYTLDFGNDISSATQGLKQSAGGYKYNHKFNMKDLIKKQKTVENKNKTRRRIISIKNNSQKKKLFSTKTKKNKK